MFNSKSSASDYISSGLAYKLDLDAVGIELQDAGDIDETVDADEVCEIEGIEDLQYSKAWRETFFAVNLYEFEYMVQQQVEELQNRTVEIQPVDNSDNERRLQETIKSLERENIKRNEELERQYREDEQAVRQMLEKDKQNAIDQLTAEYEEKLKVLQQSQPQSESDDKEVFKAYFKIAYDSLNRMVEFAEGSDNKDVFKIKINNLISAFSDRNAKI